MILPRMIALPNGPTGLGSVGQHRKKIMPRKKVKEAREIREVSKTGRLAGVHPPKGTVHRKKTLRQKATVPLRTGRRSRVKTSRR
jgi:hypothetical protein